MNRFRAAAAVVLAAVLVGVGIPRGTSAVVTQTVTIGTNTHLVVTYRGNGHGHGMSQYGALGAANAGLLYPSILFFYYPHTALTVASPSARIRVLISGVGTATTVAADGNLVVTGVTGALPTTGIAKYRLVANSASGLTLQKLATTSGATWQNVKTGLANNAEFRHTNGASVRLYRTDGTSTRYLGVLRAVRASATGTSGGVHTVNRVTYDQYAMGVTPREVSASWPAAAVDAQAVAARTYGDYAVHNPARSYYDICDSSSCQVYGGHVHYNADGTIAYRDLPKAATDTSNQILQYNAGPVFAQFSASNGGWTVSGGQPYLVAKQDPYDTAPTDPYIGAKKTITVASLAASFGLPKLTKLVITRDGNGTWGGRVLTVTGFNGTTAVKMDGSSLQSALGLGTTWVQLTPSA
ncbi:MAG TPA: SpoIID/LytB domain-containing protein [Jatrophihabitantaceae bacterium]|nr:SpoIID/LytB domain-containing protein [Jatrophihabitantaceae bacterium]